uniref:Uncharacterized protein n=1 Tax=Acrobeloides nanus TaxID=290746 RepID=A0A914CK51_9BILA
MSGGILSILLLIEVVSVSGALLKWFPPTIQYKSNKFGLSNGIRYEPSNKQSDEKLNSSNQPPFWKNIPWYSSFFAREATTESPSFIQNLETISPLSMVNIELSTPLLKTSTPPSKPRKYNPLCFFSALQCPALKKGVYYRPRI